MLKLFVRVLSSQMTNKGERLTRLFQQTVCFPEMICHPFYNFTENAYLLCVCVLSLVDSKAQLPYLGSSNTAVLPWLVLWFCFSELKHPQ